MHEATAGRDGFVSFECTPDVAYDARTTILQAREFWQRLGRSNVMIKVPATEAGVEAIEELTAEGINVNVTADAGLNLDAITAELEADGVRAFSSSYAELLSCIRSKLATSA